MLYSRIRLRRPAVDFYLFLSLKKKHSSLFFIKFHQTIQPFYIKEEKVIMRMGKLSVGVVQSVKVNLIQFHEFIHICVGGVFILLRKYGLK